MNEIMAYGLRFIVVRVETHKGTERTIVMCPLCRREMTADSAYPHVEKHQARDAKGASKAALRELGASKPAPGQLGLSMGGGRSSSLTSSEARRR